MADWFAILLRWLCILGLTIGLSFANDLNIVFGVNSVPDRYLELLNLTILAVSNRRTAGYWYINVIVDGICMIVLYILLERGCRVDRMGVSSLVLSSSAIYFSLWG